jgi:hypothetical protein
MSSSAIKSTADDYGRRHTGSRIINELVSHYLRGNFYQQSLECTEELLNKPKKEIMSSVDEYLSETSSLDEFGIKLNRPIRLYLHGRIEEDIEISNHRNQGDIELRLNPSYDNEAEHVSSMTLDKGLKHSAF